MHTFGLANYKSPTNRNRDTLFWGFGAIRYSMGVWKIVYKVCDQYDGEKAGFQYGFGLWFPIGDINPSHLYCGLYALLVWKFGFGILTIYDVF